MVDISVSIDPLIQDVLFDPQTSGGLLVCLERESADALLKKLKQKGMVTAAIIDEVLNQPKERIIVDSGLLIS